MSSTAESVIVGATLLVVAAVGVKYRQKISCKPSSKSGDGEASKANGGNVSTIDALIGNTPLLKLEKLSLLTGCDIYVKVRDHSLAYTSFGHLIFSSQMESMNPSGTGKDRAVQYMLKEAKKHPSYGPNVSIIEGTSGSTGIALAYQCNALLGANASTSTGYFAPLLNTIRPLIPPQLNLISPLLSHTHTDHAGLQLYIVMPDDQADEKKALLEKLGAKVVITPCSAISNKV